MASSYGLLPTSESSASTDHLPVPAQPSQRTALWKKLVLALGAVLALYLAFRAGEYSANKDCETVPGPEPTTGPVIDKPTPTPTPPTKPKPDIPMVEGKRSVGYFVNWGIYGRKYPPSLIPVNDLTHILYSFANVRTDTGEVVLSDPWADKDIHYPGDSWNDSGSNLYGNFKAIYKLKKANRHLKVLLSIGGWTYSPAMHPIVVNPHSRANFVSSALRHLEDYGLDGIDVDYEYPKDDEHAWGYVELLRELRSALDKHAAAKGNGCRFLLTIAAPCGPDNYRMLRVAEMDRSLDFWNLMAYDFSGPWDHKSNHQANLYGGDLNVAQAVDHYIYHGVHPSKLVLGIPLYGRSFMNTDGPGLPYQGVGTGTWEAGTYDYRVLPLPGSEVNHDNQDVASWSYNPQTREMITYDDEVVARWKGEYIKHKGLGGSMFWELSGDKSEHGGAREGMEGGPGKEPQPGQSLVRIVKDAMGRLEDSPNWLWYNESQFENMRHGME